MTVDARLLPSPCWWIDRGDCWEITHHPTRQAAETAHENFRVHGNHPISTFNTDSQGISCVEEVSLVDGIARREVRCCYEVVCPDCGTLQHIQDLDEDCVEGCGYVFDPKEIPPNDPDQNYLFGVLTTDDINQPHMVVLFAEGD